MSFVEYLTDTRMKEAMRLLKETSEKIYVVAQKVGYLESRIFSLYLRKNMECPRSSAATGAIDGRLYGGGKSDRTFGRFLPKQSMQNILYVIILTLTLLVAVFVGFFVSKSQQEKQAQIIVQDNQELAEQINVSMSQYLHSMMRLSDTLLL